MRETARSLRRHLQRILYRGSQYECPACGAQLKRFKASGASFPVLKEKRVVGAGYRENNSCPVCWVNDRERLLLCFFQAVSNMLPTDAVILHVAPEPSLCRFFGARPEITHIRADYLRPAMSVRLDVQKLPLPEASVDLVICNHVLEHVDDDALAMQEIRRVMKSNAKAVLQAPIALNEAATFEDPSITDPRERERLFGQHDHVRLYGRDYGERLEAAGFRVKPIHWREQPEAFGGNTDRYGLNPEETLYLVQKT